MIRAQESTYLDEVDDWLVLNLMCVQDSNDDICLT